MNDDRPSRPVVHHLSLRHLRSPAYAYGARLPAIGRRHKWPAFVAGYLGFCLLYMLTGRVHLGGAVLLPVTVLDRRIPFLSPTVWIYHTQFFFLLAGVRALRQPAVISRTLYAMAAASLISFAVFFVYPTTLPRVEVSAGPLTRRAFALLYAIDPPTNCLPSLHVALAWVAALGVGKENRRAGVAALAWAALISLSTLTTKQHYLIDVLAGLCVAALCWLLMNQSRHE
jgi:membrane-associated phospholipid phosphatase